MMQRLLLIIAGVFLLGSCAQIYAEIVLIGEPFSNAQSQDQKIKNAESATENTNTDPTIPVRFQPHVTTWHVIGATPEELEKQEREHAAIKRQTEDALAADDARKNAKADRIVRINSWAKNLNRSYYFKGRNAFAFLSSVIIDGKPIDSQIGEIFELDAGRVSWEVLQCDKKVLLIRAIGDFGFGTKSTRIMESSFLMIDRENSDQMVDGQAIKGFIALLGSKTYTTVNGASKTVPWVSLLGSYAPTTHTEVICDEDLKIKSEERKAKIDQLKQVLLEKRERENAIKRQAEATLVTDDGRKKAEADRIVRINSWAKSLSPSFYFKGRTAFAFLSSVIIDGKPIDSQIGEIFELDAGRVSWEVLQCDKKMLLIRAIGDFNFGTKSTRIAENSILMVDREKSDQIIDGQAIKGFIVLLGSKNYTTVSGASKTVPWVRLLKE